MWWLTPAPVRSAVDTRDMLTGLRHVVSDRRFWRIAPLSAAMIGATFSIHGLWAARWLADTARFDPHAINLALLGMGIMLTAGALAMGTLATVLRRFGVTTTALFATCGALCMVLEGMLASGSSGHPAMVLGAFAVFGSTTVLSFTIMGELFPPHLAGRANGALNVLHFAAASTVQAAIGGVVAAWGVLPDGFFSAAGYSVAFGALALAQGMGLLWFLFSPTCFAAAAGLRRAAPASQPPGRILASWPSLSRPERQAVRRSLATAVVIACLLVGLITALALTVPGTAVIAARGW